LTKKKEKKTIEPAANNQIINDGWTTQAPTARRKKENETLTTKKTTLKIKRGEHHFQKNGIETKMLKKNFETFFTTKGKKQRLTLITLTIETKIHETFCVNVHILKP